MPHDCLLCQDLVRRHACSPGLLLPPVLPLVFYNGVPRWSASMELADLLMEAPAELAALQPSQRYVLIDQQRLDKTALEANEDLLALLFRLELSLFSDVSDEVLPALVTWYEASPQTSLRTSVQTWISGLLAPGTGNTTLFDLDSVKEVTEMEGRVGTWAEQIEETGFKKGCAQGVKEGQAIALRKALGSLLRGRFGSLPEPAAQRIGQASQAQLEQWFDAVLTAPSLAAIFDEDAAAAHARPD